MKNITLNLNGIDDIKFFNTEACKTKLNIDMKVGNRCVAGKSLLGIMSLDLSDKIIVKLIGAEEEIEKFIKTIDRLLIIE